MFAYSPFFNSGLLATANRAPGSRHRRSSLPESTTYTSSSHRSTSAYYVALQRRDHTEHRSFLSLDLAESTLSQRHGPSRIPPVPALPPLVISPLTSLFPSTSSIKSLPSPKPAPSIMLPDPPPPPYSTHHHHPTSPPRLPELPVLPALQFPPTYTKIPQRPLPAPPSPSKPQYDRSSVLTKPKHLRSKKPKGLGIITNPDRLSRSSVSTASTRVRRRNRWDALDALEGRRKPPVPVPPVPHRRNLNMHDVFVNPSTFAKPKPLPKPIPNSNFINMSDDSDPEPLSSSSYSTVSDDDSDVLPNPLLETEDIVLPAPARPRPPSSLLDSASYLDVDEGIILEARRCPAPSSPPPPVITPIPNQRAKVPAKKTKSSKPTTSSKRHNKPSSSNNHSHYKSFMELDMDDLLEQDGPDESTVELFEWRGRIGRGLTGKR